MLRTLGILGLDQKISAAEMKAYEDVFTAPIPMAVLSAITALVDRELPADPEASTPTTAPLAAAVAV